jgi:hypothetical protein
MGTHRRFHIGPSRANHRRTALLGVGIGLSVLASFAPAALAETYEVPEPIWNYRPLLAIGTEGDEAWGWFAVTHGGCTGRYEDGRYRTSGYALAIGENNRSCDEAYAGGTAVGLSGADANSESTAVATDGDAYAYCCLSTHPTLAVSGTGSAEGNSAISGTGRATSNGGPYLGSMAVSGTGDATGPLAISGTGNASGTTAVSGTGEATGTTALSVLGGRRAGGDLAFRGRATLPQFPCPHPPGTGCWGSFAGDWTGHVSGTHHGSAFEATWTTTTATAVNASFRYWELACLAGAETLAGQAAGTGSASAAPNQVIGHWLQKDELGARAVVGATLSFTFQWTRSANAAVLVLQPTALELDVAGLGLRTVATGLQTGTATFALTSADNTTVPTCSTPMANAIAEVVGTVPLSFVG